MSLSKEERKELSERLNLPESCINEIDVSLEKMKNDYPCKPISHDLIKKYAEELILIRKKSQS